MAIRHPPDDHIPRVVRSARPQSPKVIRYEEPRPGFVRRAGLIFLRPFFVIPAVVLAVLVVAILTYYWVVFSKRIDNLLKGEVFTRSAGIYAAPKQIRVRQTTTT